MNGTFARDHIARARLAAGLLALGLGLLTCFLPIPLSAAANGPGVRITEYPIPTAHSLY